MCMIVVITAQLFHAYSRAYDHAQLQDAHEIEGLARALDENSTQFQVSAIDLINEANGGADAPFRRIQMRQAAEQLRQNFAALRARVEQSPLIHSSEMVIGGVDDAMGLILSASPADDENQRELLEAGVDQLTAQLDIAIADTGAWAVAERQHYSAQLEQTDRVAAYVILISTAIAFAVGIFFYRRLERGVFPVANDLRQAIVAMANGRLDRPLPDQRYSEPQQMTLALRKLRAAARRENQYARIDFLTDLPNRRAMAQRLAAWPSGQPGSVMIVDVDGFKLVNDSFGHPVGDELVRRVAQRLQSLVPEGAMVARLGGDEFAVLVTFDDPDAIAALGAKIVASCAEPIQALGNSLSISVSVGIAPLQTATDRALELAEALRPSDLALYAAKANGRNGYAIFKPEMRQAADLLHLIENDLDAAIADGGLHLEFQPILAEDGGEKEVEALLRWDHPSLGAVSPEKLIAVAERSGQMERLGNWIIETALDALASWPQISISINLSQRQLRSPNFASNFSAQCRQRSIAPKRVILEITESVAVDNSDHALRTLCVLQTIGFRIALDDFGKGYSSLWMLKQFGFDRLKIDRSLVEDTDRNAQARAVLVAAVEMGRRLDMEVVAEGVDSDAMASDLAAIGCTHLQGFWFSRPLTNAAVPRFFDSLVPPLRIAG